MKTYQPKDMIITKRLEAELGQCMMALQEALDEFETTGVLKGEEIPGWVILAKRVLKENRAAFTELGLNQP